MAVALLRSPLLRGACSAESESGARILPSPSGGQGSLKGTEFPGRLPFLLPEPALGALRWEGGMQFGSFLTSFRPPHSPPHPRRPSLLKHEVCFLSRPPEGPGWKIKSPSLLEKEGGGVRVLANSR